MTITLQLVVGLALLIGGAELLVRAASRLAAALGVPPLVVGLTVVAFGTSAPELAVSIGASLGGQADVAVGNVVGSNIFNVLLILGLAAVLVPLAVQRPLVRRDVPVMIGVSVLVLLLGLDGAIGRVDGLVLVAGLIVYTVLLVRAGRRENGAVAATVVAVSPPFRWRDVVLVGVGLALLVAGSRSFVAGAVTLAGRLGISELVVGLTIVAAGTSLPEVATSVVASLRGERDIAVGNVVGSNLFNLLAVLGLSGVVAPGGLAVPAAALRVDLPVMIAAAVACLPIFATGHRISRGEGAWFLACYVAYTTYLILTAARSPWLPAFNLAMLGFGLPLTVGGLTVSLVRTRRRRG